MSKPDESIRSAVRMRYAAIATAGDCGCRTEESDCCKSTELDSQLYEAAVVSDVPIDLLGESLGCGDPVTIAGLKSGEVVLDLGSGAGLDCFLVARQVGTGGLVIGVDMTAEMIVKAEANRQKLGYQNVEFRQGEIENLPVEDECIDVVMSNCVINLSPDKAAVFQEAYRVLKPGGRFSVSDIVTEGGFKEEHQSNLASWAACITGAIDISEYTRMMQEAGFQEIVIHNQEPVSENIADLLGMPRVFRARTTARKGFPNMG